MEPQVVVDPLLRSRETLQLQRDWRKITVTEARIGTTGILTRIDEDVDKCIRMPYPHQLGMQPHWAW